MHTVTPQHGAVLHGLPPNADSDRLASVAVIPPEIRRCVRPARTPTPLARLAAGGDVGDLIGALDRLGDMVRSARADAVIRIRIPWPMHRRGTGRACAFLHRTVTSETTDLAGTAKDAGNFVKCAMQMSEMLCMKPVT
jgi:hypothetical protein